MQLPRRRWLLIVFALCALAILGGGAWVYRAQEASIRRDVEAELEAIATLKANQIAQWRAERLGDAAVVMSSPLLIEGVARWLSDPQPRDGGAIITRFRALQSYYGYDDVLLVDSAGQVRLGLRGDHGPLDPHAQETVQRAWIEARPLMVGLHLRADGTEPHVGFVAPLFAEDGEPVAAVILMVDAESFLYPLIQTWPLPSDSAESLLVRREGDDVLFLNELRHTPNAALSLRIPLTRTDVPAVMAVQGRRGVYEGLDYRGAPVVSAIRDVPDSPWFIVAKVDRAEVYAEWRRYSYALLGLILALLGGLVAGTIALLQGRERAYYERLARAETALQTSETRYRTTLLSVGDGVIVTDGQGRVEIMNAVAEELTGWPLEQAVGQRLNTVFDIVNEETRQPVENPATRVLREGAIVGLANHTVLLGRDGVERPIADSGAPVRDETGGVSGVVLVFRDQTEERAAQQALAESESRFRTLFDASPLAVGLYDLDGHLVRCNPTMMHLLGYTQEELAEMDPTHPDDRLSGAELFVQLVSGKIGRYQREKRYVRKDGSVLWAQLTAAPILGADGRPEYVTLVFEDITERRRAEESLRENEERFRGLFEHSLSGVALHEIVLDEQGNPVDYIFLDANPAFETLTGLRVADILGRRVTEVLPGIEGSPFIETYGQVALTGESVSFEQLSEPLGRHYYINAYRLGENRFATVFMDISERRRAEEALRESEELLRMAGALARLGGWTVDLVANRMTWSDQVAEIHGMPPGYSPSVQDGINYYAPEYRERISQVWTACITEGIPYDEELQIINAQGERVWVRTLGSPVRDETGAIVRVYGGFQDIAERKQAEAAVTASETRYRRLFEAAKDGILILNGETGQVVDANPFILDLLGLTREALLGTELWQLGLFTDIAASRAAFVELRDNGYVRYEDLPLMGADGRRRQVEFISNVYQANGESIIQCNIRDITERKEAEEALAQERALLRTVIDNLPDAVYVKSAQGRRILGNPADLRNMGLADEADILGKMDSEIFDAETAAAYMADDRFVIETGQPLLGREEWLVRPDGERRWLLTSKLPVRDPDGHVIGLAGISRDITERKQAEEHRALQALRIEMLLRLHEMADATQDEIMSFGLEACLQIVKSRLAFIGLMDDDEAVLHTHAWSPSSMQQCADTNAPLDFAVADGGLWAECLRQRRAIVINDYAAPHPAKRGLPEGHASLKRLLCVPVFDGERIAAVAAVANKEEPYDTEDVAALTALMNRMWELLRHKQYEQQLRESALQYRTLADSGQALIWTAGTDKLCNYFNEPWLAFTGRTLEQELGNGWTEGIHPDDLERCIQIYTTAFDRRERFSMTYRLRRHDGEYRWIQDDGSPRYDAEGRFAGYIGHCLDVTEQRRAQEALRESEARYRRLAEHAPDVIFRYRLLPEPGLEYISPAVEAITGYSPQECYADPMLMVNMAHPDDAHIMSDLLTTRDVPPEPLTMRWIGKDGSARWMETRMIPLHDDEGRLLAVEGITRDMTQRILEEQERQRLEQRLQDSQKIEAVGRLAGGVAHDFNNMLQTILGYAEMAIQDAPPDGPLGDYLAEIRSAGQRSAALTRQLLAFARRQTIQPQALDLNEHVANTLKMLGRLIAEDTSLVWKPGAHLGQVMMDPSQVDQILANLVVNARDAIEGQGEILIETENVAISEAYVASHLDALPGKYVMLVVTDNGCGMDAETRTHLFEPFFTTKAIGEGTGLGLATIYGIVKQNEGFINVYSEPGRGTTFRIYLPRHDVALQPDNGESEPSALPRGVETVLLVEDEEALLRLAVRLLTQLGYNVLAANSPQEAERLHQEYEGEIHLLMTDVVMPGMNGRELAERLRPQRPGMKYLFMSGYTANVIAHRGVVDHGVAFLQKPFSLETLARHVRAALDGDRGA
jgi:PAS domain S-box-containing protein